MNDPDFIRRIQALVGKRCSVNGEAWEVLDVLADEATLVLRRLGAGDAPIQEDAFGSPVRRVPDTRMVPLFSADGDLNEEARELLLALQSR